MEWLRPSWRDRGPKSRSCGSNSTVDRPASKTRRALLGAGICVAGFPNSVPVISGGPSSGEPGGPFGHDVCLAHLLRELCGGKRGFAPRQEQYLVILGGTRRCFESRGPGPARASSAFSWSGSGRQGALNGRIRMSDVPAHIPLSYPCRAGTLDPRQRRPT